MKDLAVRIRAIEPLSVLPHLVVEPSFVNYYKLLFAELIENEVFHILTFHTDSFIHIVKDYRLRSVSLSS